VDEALPHQELGAALRLFAESAGKAPGVDLEENAVVKELREDL